MDSKNDEPFDFSLTLPSLQELTRIRVARNLWRTPEIVNSVDFQILAGFGIRYCNLKNPGYNSTVKELLKKVSHLPVPGRVKKQIIPLVYHVGNELYKWFLPYRLVYEWYDDDFYEWEDEIIKDFLSNDRINWTAYGTIDTIETARMVMRQGNIPIKSKYDLACKFCLEDEIGRLWDELKLKDKKIMMGEISFEKEITRYWSCKKEKRPWYQDGLYKNNLAFNPEVYFLKKAIDINSPAFPFMFNCFCPKLNETQKCTVEKLIGRRHVLYEESNLFEGRRFFLNLMDRQQQVAVLRNNTSEFLLKCLSRPWQRLFFPILYALMEHIDETTFCMFLNYAGLVEWDDNTRDEFYAALRPLCRKHVRRLKNNYVLMGWMYWWIGGEERLDLVKTLVSDAPVSLKTDVIAVASLFCHSDSSRAFNGMKTLVLEWFTPDTWPALKSLLITKNERSNFNDFKDFFEYFDDHFANLSLDEADGGARSSKRLKIDD